MVVVAMVVVPKLRRLSEAGGLAEVDSEAEGSAEVGWAAAETVVAGLEEAAPEAAKAEAEREAAEREAAETVAAGWAAADSAEADSAQTAPPDLTP